MTNKKEVMQFARDQLAPVTGDRPVATPAVSPDAAGNQQDREEVMQIDAGTNARPGDGSPVAPPPSTSGGGDQVLILDRAEWARRIHAYAADRVAAETAALHEKIAALENRLLHAGSDANDAECVVSFQKERAEIAERRCEELRAKLAESEASDAESVAMYRNARDRAEALQRERDEARSIVDACAKVIRDAGRHTRGGHETPHDLVGLIEVMRRDLDEARATASETNTTIAKIYEKIPSLPLSAESLDAATDALTAFCFMVGALGLDPDAILADRGGGL